MKKQIRLLVLFMGLILSAVLLAVGFMIMSVPKVYAAGNIVMTMSNGAEIRTLSPCGIRFTTTYYADFDSLDTTGYSFGTLIIPTDMLGENEELTHETENCLNVRQIVWKSNTSSEHVFCAVLIDIPNDSYGRNISARSYYKPAEGDYVYSDITVERSVAYVASYALNAGETNSVLYEYVEEVAESVNITPDRSDISETRVDMVVGGKETLSLTTSPANYGVVYTSSNPSVATVNKNGVINAVSNGTATVTATFGNKTDTVSVSVADYVQRDGSEFTYTVENSAATIYAATNETIGGRTGIYKYSGTEFKNWTDKLTMKEILHYGTSDGYAKIAALRNFKNKGYNYALFNLYMTSGSILNIGALKTETVFADDRLTAAGSYAPPETSVHGDNENVKVYNLGGVDEVNTISLYTWYTVVIDYSNIDVAVYQKTASVYSFIQLGGIQGVIYLDNVRYYADNSWETELAAKTSNDYDGSEFVVAKSGGLAGTYQISESAIGGRTGVYEFNTSAASWSDKIGVKQANHIGTKIYASAAKVAANMSGQHYNYVVFDFYLVSGGFAISAPEYTYTDETTYTVEQKYKRVFGTWGDGTSTKITRYKNGVAHDGYSKNEWYTVVVEYAVDANYTGQVYHGVDISAIPTGAEPTVQMYIDNVRYCSVNPFA